ncbi:MAG: tetratricopeptide repeat protein, partial [Bacteroidales bacterium]|nr:tetratricopeptide repeat protein [Bacteroidales bacterium]
MRPKHITLILESDFVSRRYDEALDLLDQVLVNTESPTYKIALQNKGDVLRAQNKFKEADSVLQMSIAMFPTSDNKRYICMGNL